ncbi:hypothetical protein [Microbacterium rhizomatis]|uniref:Ig-like domain-containing protein n=1 Tax=Microbacterium rhizomatis TaxID=1631477 RepID=A0A5J5J1X9_9MICO|nr:hypothetical protein [Microbacterium rhizomatis]KAA9110187.1 hypothetical protein F6B43_00305 [Microbacterium rhizomatis]
MQTAPVGFDAAIAARSIDTLTVEAAAATSGVDVAAATGWGERITVDRQMSGELPEEASDVVGSVSTTLTIEGDAYAPGAPSPMRDAEAWLNSASSVKAGYGGIKVPVFTGRVADLDASEGSGALTLTARDSSERLTAPVLLRPYGSYGRRSATGAAFRHPTNTQAVVTSILHTNGIRMTPAPRAGCELSVPGVGGWLADVGWTAPLGQSNVTSPWLVPGRFGSMPDSSAEIIRGYFATRRAFSGSVTMVEAFVLFASGMSQELLRIQSYVGAAVTLEVASGSLSVVWRPDPSTSSVVASASIANGWHHVAFEVVPRAYVQVWVDGVSVLSTTSVWAGALPTTDIDCVIWSPGAMQGVAAHWNAGAYNAVPTPSIMTFTPDADLSTGALDLMSIPDVDGRASWEVLQEIAQAELGMVGFSEAGRFFFKSRADLAANTSPVATWGIDLIDDIHASVSMDSVFTRATAKVKRVVGVDSGRGTVDVVPSLIADSVLSVPVGTSSVIVSASQPNVVDGQQVAIITATGAALNVPVGMVLCYGENGLSRYTGGQVTAWITNVGIKSWRVTFRNDSAFQLYAAWPADFVSAGTQFGLKAGDPGFWINGYTYDPSNALDEVVDRSNAGGVGSWGIRLHQFSDSVWRQDAVPARAFLDAMLADTAQPRAQIADVTVPADPRWQIGDPVRVTDWRGRVPGFVARITAIKLTIDRAVENGMTGVYGLRQIPGAIPRVTSGPADRSVSAGSTAAFTVAATGAAGYRWQVLVPGGSGWVDIAGATSATYTTPATVPADSGKQYRCNVTNATGDDWTGAATLTVT